ncbi:DNA-(apurinic or apyrimidinic site) lyase /endonuclease III [Ruminococcaceae bacterium YRB3002]|nr:DNA-(apurinic or apyrimidinic site) lyase /endonuclease III [Ruminococcaceae bacterium YRB3002]
MASNRVTKARGLKVISALATAFPDACCSLDHEAPDRLAIRGILSAQCTDKRVNATAVELFEKYPTMDDIKAAPAEDISGIIKPCGLTASKTRSVQDFARKYCDEWGHEVPCDVDALMTCYGVGRKIANLIVGEVYGVPAIVVDTHCKRVMYRLGLTDNTDPLKVEEDLNRVVPDEYKISLGHMAVDLGKTYCKAQKPMCSTCPVSHVCMKKV